MLGYAVAAAALLVLPFLPSVSGTVEVELFVFVRSSLLARLADHVHSTADTCTQFKLPKSDGEKQEALLREKIMK
jgi:hypothetical protein